QAEDGIRDLTVTGVQTCALPISTQLPQRLSFLGREHSEEKHHDPLERYGHVCRDAVGSGSESDPGRMVQRLRGLLPAALPEAAEIGRASCRERGELTVVAASVKI